MIRSILVENKRTFPFCWSLSLGFSQHLKSEDERGKKNKGIEDKA